METMPFRFRAKAGPVSWSTGLSGWVPLLVFAAVLFLCVGMPLLMGLWHIFGWELRHLG